MRWGIRTLRTMIDRGLRAGAVALAVALAGCTGFGDRDPPPGQPSFYRSLAQPGAEVDAAAAQSMISGYRQNNGLTPVVIDPTLTRLARFAPAPCQHAAQRSDPHGHRGRLRAELQVQGVLVADPRRPRRQAHVS